MRIVFVTKRFNVDLEFSRLQPEPEPETDEHDSELSTQTERAQEERWEPPESNRVIGFRPNREKEEE